MSKDIISPLIKQRSKIIHQVKKYSSKAKAMCIDARKNLSESIKITKTKWTNKMAESIRNIHQAPKEAWKAVMELKAGQTGHHEKKLG